MKIKCHFMVIALCEICLSLMNDTCTHTQTETGTHNNHLIFFSGKELTCISIVY